MDSSIIGRNLRHLRALRRMSQSACAAEAGITRAALARIENGESVPRTGTLESLAKALDVDMSELLTESPTLDRVRFRAAQGHRDRDQVIADVARRLKQYCDLEKRLGDRKEFAFKPKAGMKPKELAHWVRQHSALKEEPIRDICGFLEESGVKVLRILRATDSFFGLSVAPDDCGPAVVVNTWQRISVERWIFSAAHELGHLLMHLQAYDPDETEENVEEEKQADTFAAYLLMPEKLFDSEWQETRGLPIVDRILKVKRIFRVSYKTVIYRLIEKGEADNSAWQWFQIRYKNKYGRTLRFTDEPEALERADLYQGKLASQRAEEPEKLSEIDFQEDRYSRLVRRAFDEGLISMGYAAETLDLSRREMRTLAREWAGSDDGTEH